MYKNHTPEPSRNSSPHASLRAGSETGGTGRPVAMRITGCDAWRMGKEKERFGCMISIRVAITDSVGRCRISCKEIAMFRFLRTGILGSFVLGALMLGSTLVGAASVNQSLTLTAGTLSITGLPTSFGYS